MTGAQLSRRAHECPVEDYASAMLRSTSGIVGAIEVGNGFPRDGTDGEWKIAGRDAILTMKDGIVKLATAEGDEKHAANRIGRRDHDTPADGVEEVPQQQRAQEIARRERHQMKAGALAGALGRLELPPRMVAHIFPFSSSGAR